MPRILTIIITFNALRWIEKNIKSVLSSTVRTDIIVIDNGSTDGTQEYITSAFPSVRFIQNSENQGFGAANNIGIRIAKSENYDFVYLLNQDAYLQSDTLEKLLSAKQKNTCFGILSPIQLAADGTLDPRFKKRTERYLKRANTSKSIVPVPFVMAAHWLISREALLSVGGFSPSFKQYGEDDNYLHRLHFHGLRVGIVPSASAIHDRSKRAQSKAQKMQLKCVAPSVRVSNPNSNFRVQVAVSLAELIAMSVKNLSLAPLQFIPKFLKKLPELKQNRKKTFEKAAFL